MSQVQLTCGFEKVSVASDFFRPATVDKGKQLFEANHVGNVVEIRNVSSVDISLTAKCLSQVRTSITYEIHMKIDQARLLVEAKCSCKAGSVGKCKHTAAVIHSLNNFQDDTPTSGPCQWTIPKKTKDYSQGVTIATLFPSKMDSVNILGIHPTSLLETFQHLQCPLMTVLQKERDLSSLSPAIGTDDVKIRMDAEFEQFMKHALQCDLLSFIPVCEPPEELQEFYYGMVANANDDFVKLAWSTRKQSLCSEWHKLRKIRMSSTKAHPVKTRKRNFHSLAYQLVNNKFRGNADTDYGISMESEGREKYAQVSKNRIIEVGLVVCPKLPWLCASPDGIIVTKGPDGNDHYKLLEVKSPSSRKGSELIDRQEGKSWLPYLEIKDGSVQLKQNHPYFTQVQVSMLVTNVKECDLVIHSSVDLVICKVPRDDKFLEDVIGKLEDFYFKHLITEIVDAF